MPKKIVITGGPGSGKTSLVSYLLNIGHQCIPEISRAVTIEAQKQGIEQLFLEDPILFSQKLLEGRLAQFNDTHKLEKNNQFYLPKTSKVYNLFEGDMARTLIINKKGYIQSAYLFFNNSSFNKQLTYFKKL